MALDPFARGGFSTTVRRGHRRAIRLVADRQLRAPRLAEIPECDIAGEARELRDRVQKRRRPFDHVVASGIIGDETARAVRDPAIHAVRDARGTGPTARPPWCHSSNSPAAACGSIAPE